MNNADLAHWNTWAEIHAQPDIWRDWAATFDVKELASWIANQSVDEIWLTGAGTSAYIGEIVVAGLEGRRGPKLRSIPSTDIVSRPHAYLKDRRPLVISFGRSGDSAESLGVLDALDALAPDAPRLNITCNPSGALATRQSNAETRIVLLPKATHDRGFAMTSSFSTMLLTALGVLTGHDLKEPCAMLATAMEELLATANNQASIAPERAVFVGAGPLTFAAREAALKVMELSAGRIPAIWDSSLGFRHGPKSFVVGACQVHVLLSQHHETRRYDTDLLAELKAQFPQTRIVGIGPGGDWDIKVELEDVWLSVLHVAYAQICAVLWANDLGLDIDNPFVGRGTLTRVVSGVQLYEVTP